MWKHNAIYGNENRTAQNKSASVINFLYNGYRIALAGSSNSDMGNYNCSNSKRGNYKIIQVEEGDVPPLLAW